MKGFYNRSTVYRIKVHGYTDSREVSGKTLPEVKRMIANDDFLYDKAVYVFRDAAMLTYKNPFSVTFKRV